MDDTDTACYADNNTLYITADDIGKVLAFLENTSESLLKWFCDNIYK